MQLNVNENHNEEWNEEIEEWRLRCFEVAHCLPKNYIFLSLWDNVTIEISC